MWALINSVQWFCNNSTRSSLIVLIIAKSHMEILLHLTDLHFGCEGDKPAAKAKRLVCLKTLLDKISELPPEWKPTIICITGDLVWRAATSDYADAKKWLDQLLKCCGLAYDKMILCAGNHEVDRAKAIKIPRPANAIEADTTLELPLAEHFVSLFSTFSQFCQDNDIPILKIGESESYLVGERTINNIRFVVLNSAWCSKDDKDQNNLWLGFPHLISLEANDQLVKLEKNSSAPFAVTLIHHPFDWLHENDNHAMQGRPNTKDHLAKRCNIILTGHTHAEVRDPDQIANGAHHFTGGATYADVNYENSFRLIRIENSVLDYQSFEFDPRSADGEWKPHKVKKLRDDSGAIVKSTIVSIDNQLEIKVIRAALRSDAVRQRERKSRLIRPTGKLPNAVPQAVSVRVSPQHEQFDAEDGLLRREQSEQIMPFYEAIRLARQTLLLGDLGSGKSSLAADLVIHTIDKTETTLAFLIPVKFLNLADRLSPLALLKRLEEYLVAELILADSNINIASLLKQHVEILIVFDGLDELARDVAARLLQQAAKLTEHWATIQIVATARPVEMHGISFADWRLAHTTALDRSAKQTFLLEELLADGVSPSIAHERAKELLRTLDALPALANLATSPLTIRLLYPQIKLATATESLTLGDLLYQLLKDRLDGWQKRDDKPENFSHFQNILPSAEAKIIFFANLSKRAAFGTRTTLDEAKAILTESAQQFPGADKFRLAMEALDYFEWLGLILKTDCIEFPLQPLAEVATAVGLLNEWVGATPVNLPAGTKWRVVSFVAAIARRQGLLQKINKPLQAFITGLLTLESVNFPAACYIVAETNNEDYAHFAVNAFVSLEWRPIRVIGEDLLVSIRSIARTIWLAGDVGFSWFFSQYIDPRYPLSRWGSANIGSVFREWAALAIGHLTASQQQKLAIIVAPYLATAGAHFSGVLEILALLIPEAFTPQDRIWYQSSALDNAHFGDFVRKQFNILAQDKETRPLLDKILLARLVNNSMGAAALWLDLNKSAELSGSLVRVAFGLFAKSTDQELLLRLIAECRTRLGQGRWLRFARWFLTDEDTQVAAGAAMALYESGEWRLPILGDALMKSLHDGAYKGDSEKILNALIAAKGDGGIRWLINYICNSSEHYGAHSGWWRILLASIDALPDGPALLCRCTSKLGPFTLPRYPEVRELFTRLLKGQRGSEYCEALRKQLYSYDPTERCGAAKILLTIDPHSEGEALFTAVQSHARVEYGDEHEWESFCLSLDFSPSVLVLLQSRLALLPSVPRGFALLILEKNEVEIELADREELIATLFSPKYNTLLYNPAAKAFLEKESSFGSIMQRLDFSDIQSIQRAAAQLIEIHGAKLSPETEAKCIAIKSTTYQSHTALTALMLRMMRESTFTKLLSHACQALRAQGYPALLLENIAGAIHGMTSWKDVVWALLCDDANYYSSGHADEFGGQALMQFAIAVPQHQTAIGDAARECFSDPRMVSNRWIDAYHWLAVLASEFSTFPAAEIERGLLHGRPIHYAAAASLISRLGFLPQGLQFEREKWDQRKIAINSESEHHASLTAEQRLLEYARESESFHPNLLGSIEESLFLSEMTEESLSVITEKGSPGILIATTLRYCYGIPPKLERTLPLFDIWMRFSRNFNNDKAVDRLSKIWAMIRFSIRGEDSDSVAVYLAALENSLVNGDVWKFAIAIEILRIRGSLAKEHVQIVLMEYAKHAGVLHKSLLIEIVYWLTSELDVQTSDAIRNVIRIILVTLDQAAWDSSGGLQPNILAYTLFPVIHWVFDGSQLPTAERVFLRGLRIGLALEGKVPNTDNLCFADLLAQLAPLLKKAHPSLLKSAIEAGLTLPEPSVQAFCHLIKSVATWSE